MRTNTGMGELDRVLGGGLVGGSLVLLSGDPGIGKSTLLLQICKYLGKECKVLYVSGEESERQIKLRADRLGVEGDNLYLLSEMVKINGEDISYIYDVVNGTDKIYRIYDLYNGTINERNSDDIFSIHLGLLRKAAFGYKEINGINAKENEICGDCKKSLSTQESTFIYNLINKRIGYKKQFDIYDINSIIDAIIYKKTAPEIAKDFLEKELGIPYEEFDKLDCDEQHKILQAHKKILKSTIVKDSGKVQSNVDHRAAKLYKFDIAAYNKLLRKGLFFSV